MGLLTNLKLISPMSEDTPLYSSTKDEQPEVNQAAIFAPEPEPSYIMKEPVKPADPVYAQTVIPTKVQIVPDVAQIPEDSQALKVDPEKMTKYFSEPVCRQIIDDLKNNRPLVPKVAEILIRKDIVREATLSETVPATKQVVLPSVPVRKKRSNLIDKSVNFIYKLLYNK